MKKKHKDKNIWDKKRLAIETVTAIIIGLAGIKFGQQNSTITYNGNVITQQIYLDTIASINQLNEQESENITGSDIAEFALRFEGGAYALGGTSLANNRGGVDSSGFVQQVYASFGLAIPRTSSAIASIGEEIPIAMAKEGDIICYNNHVGICIGNNQIIHASNPRLGITVSDIFYRQPLFARRIINE